MPAQLWCQSRSFVAQNSKSNIQPGNPFIVCPCSRSNNNSSEVYFPPYQRVLISEVFFLFLCFYLLTYLFISPQMKPPWCSLLRLRASLRWRDDSAKLSLSPCLRLSLSRSPSLSDSLSPSHSTHALQERTFVCTWRHSHARARTHTHGQTVTLTKRERETILDCLCKHGFALFFSLFLNFSLK